MNFVKLTGFEEGSKETPLFIPLGKIGVIAPNDQGGTTIDVTYPDRVVPIDVKEAPEEVMKRISDKNLAVPLDQLQGGPIMPFGGGAPRQRGQTNSPDGKGNIVIPKPKIRGRGSARRD